MDEMFWDQAAMEYEGRWARYEIYDSLKRERSSVMINEAYAEHRCRGHAQEKGVEFIEFVRVREGHHSHPYEFARRLQEMGWKDIELVYTCSKDGKVVEYNVPYVPFPWKEWEREKKLWESGRWNVCPCCGQTVDVR